jgi:hypothetical protein
LVKIEIGIGRRAIYCFLQQKLFIATFLFKLFLAGRKQLSSVNTGKAVHSETVELLYSIQTL